jgi:crotonobetainyl-CoA:carnitine CoA-transferase CaiB-like acyl-CoA transferase
MVGPLEGLRVLDLTTGVAGPHATKLLADFGATVTKLEPPDGDRARREGPFPGDVPDLEASAPFLVFNTNKRSVVADLESGEGIALAHRLAWVSDVVVEDLAPGRLGELGLDLEGLRAERPELVTCSITPFGQDGPYAQLPASDLVLQAMGGAMYSTGHAEREPLRLGGEYALWQAGLAGALAIMLAVFRAEAGGGGDSIDVAIYETQAGGKDRRQLNLLGHAYTGYVAQRRPAAFAIASGVKPCRDGFINLLGFDRLKAMLTMVGRPDLAARPEIGLPAHDVPRELVDEIEAAYLGWALQHEMREALQIAQDHRVLGGMVYTLADPTFRSRGVWERIEHPAAGALDYPGRPAILGSSPRPVARRAPLLGEHREEVLREVEELERGARPRAAGAPTSGLEPPLRGIRVLDLAVVWAGPFASQLLAEWGAEVIKMEPINTVQPQTRPIDTSREGWMAGNPEEPTWNRGVNFNCSGLDKRSFTGDIRTAEGRAAFLELVRISDVVVENNVPDTIERLGLTWDELSAVNPRLIYVRMPGLGLTGEYRNYRCWGNHLEAMAGHLILRAYPDATPEMAGETYACDSVAGLTAAFATLVALRHRARTGEGQLVEVPQAEAFMQLLGVEYLDYQMNERVRESVANDHRTHAPHNAYRCAGEDRWIAIDVEDDEQWRGLCGVLGLGELGADVQLATAAGRWRRRRELDRAIGAATATWSREELFAALVAAGVTAGPVQDDGDAFRCPQLRAREWFEPVTRDDLGTADYPGRLFKLRATATPARRPPPKLGADNDYVYRGLLGWDAARVEALVAAGLVGTAYSEEALARARGR